MQSLEDRIKDRIVRGYDAAKAASGPDREPTREEVWNATSHTVGDTPYFDAYMKEKGVKSEADTKGKKKGNAPAEGATESVDPAIAAVGGGWSNNVNPNA